MLRLRRLQTEGAESVHARGRRLPSLSGGQSDHRGALHVGLDFRRAQCRNVIAAMAKTARKRNAKAKTKAPSKTKAASKTKSKKKAPLKTPLYLTEADVHRLVTVKDAITTLELLFETWPEPGTVNLPRQRATIGNGALNLMGAAWGAAELFGLKAYYGAPGGRFHVLLYSSRDCTLKAMIEADHLGRMRTGAASGLATKVLANPEARTLGVIGAGRQAFTQVEAVCAVRKIETVRVFTRTAEHREAFAREDEQKLRVAAKPVSSGE